MESKPNEVPIDPKLGIEARAEKVALAIDWSDNPFRGATKRLEAAQKAARDQEKALDAEAERREGESLKESFEMHRGLSERVEELSREIDALYATVDREAKQHNIQYQYWRRTPDGMVAEADYRFIPGTSGFLDMPSGHYLAAVGPVMAKRMSAAADHDQQIQNKITARSGVIAQREMFEIRHPVLSLIRLEAATCAQ